MTKKRSGWSTESILILISAVVSFVIGSLYAWMSGFEISSFNWWVKCVAGITAVSIISNVILRFNAAWSRSKTGGLVEKIDEAIEDFRKIAVDRINDSKITTVDLLKKSEYKSEMRYLRDMMQTHKGKNYFRFHFRFEGWDRLSLFLEDAGVNCRIKILGCLNFDDTKFYICEIYGVENEECPFKVGERVACCQKGEQYLVSKYVTDDSEMVQGEVYEFEIIAMPGQIRTIPSPKLASEVKYGKRLKDEAGISFFE